jgi:hypothetical protein
MKRRFGWELEDIIYMSMKVSAGEKAQHGIKRERPSDLTEEQRTLWMCVGVCAL